MKTQEDYPDTEKITVKKVYKTTVHLFPDHETDVE